MLGLFGRHVVKRSHQLSNACQIGAAIIPRLQLRQSKVEDFHFARSIEHQIRWLHVTVDDSL